MVLKYPCFLKTLVKIMLCHIQYYSKRFSVQIALVRNSELSRYEGLCICVILDENRVNQVLVVGSYRSDTYNSDGQ